MKLLNTLLLAASAIAGYVIVQSILNKDTKKS